MISPKKRRPFPLVPVLILSLSLLLLLTSCGEQTISRQNTDGTKTYVRYRSAVPFERLPYYRFENGGLTMEFNGIPLYRVYLLSSEETADYTERQPVARSSNLTAYENPDDEQFPYLYLLDLDGSDDAWILFVSSDEPGSFIPTDPTEYRNAQDYTATISYWVGKTETAPDFAGLVPVED